MILVASYWKEDEGISTSSLHVWTEVDTHPRISSFRIGCHAHMGCNGKRTQSIPKAPENPTHPLDHTSYRSFKAGKIRSSAASLPRVGVGLSPSISQSESSLYVMDAKSLIKLTSHARTSSHRSKRSRRHHATTRWPAHP
jgi:hypothetical protein